MSARKTKIEVKAEEVKIEEKSEVNVEWFNKIYDVNLINDNELKDMYEAFKYVGFDRMEMLKELEKKAKDPKLAVQLILLCALRGPQAAAKTKLLNGLTPEAMNIPGSGQIKTKNLSCARISAATADLAAFYLKRLNVTKRLIDEECPAWLQFPSAGAIKLPQNLRNQHISFSKKFSAVIGGVFREEIYAQMMANAYYDERLGIL